MKLTTAIRLNPTDVEYDIINHESSVYIETVNDLVKLAKDGDSLSKLTTKDVKVDLPAALVNQCIRDSRSVYRKYKKALKKNPDARVPVIKKKCIYVNNQNYKIGKDSISFPVMINGKSKRINVPAKITERQHNLLKNKLGLMRVVTKNGKLYAMVTYEQDEATPLGSNVMGIDIGIKCPAVSYVNGKVKFYIKQQVNIIQMECLSNIRKHIKMQYKPTRTSRKNENSTHTWSFYRLTKYIAYKAKLAGIEVRYVNPAYTSKRCPVCGSMNTAKDRSYVCHCGYHKHRDIVGAINISTSTEFIGKR